VPTTALAIDPPGRRIYGASWDKTVICWDTETRQILLTFMGHTDFVKSLLYIPSPTSSLYPGGLLLSGSSDKCIIVWDAATGKELNSLKGHTRAIGTLALDPIESTPEIFIVYAGGSEREIRKWMIPLADIRSAKEADEPILEHDTSVIKIRFQGDDWDCWTASADFTARRIDVRDTGKNCGQKTDTIFRHGDYVNDVVLDSRGQYAITGCRDEDVRVWDIGVTISSSRLLTLC
jgi:WD40 repeat protein